VHGNRVVTLSFVLERMRVLLSHACYWLKANIIINHELCHYT
jgi:hypothetical protein